MFYKLAPEVAGHLGDNTVMDTSTHPPIVNACHYEFDGWPVDDLIEAFPCFIVTDKLKELIENAQPSGCRFGILKTSTSEEFEELEEFHSSSSLPDFSWLIISGIAGRDDFGTSADGWLIVSERILHVLRKGSLANCEIFPL